MSASADGGSLENVFLAERLVLTAESGWLTQIPNQKGSWVRGDQTWEDPVGVRVSDKLSQADANMKIHNWVTTLGFSQTIKEQFVHYVNTSLPNSKRPVDAKGQAIVEGTPEVGHGEFVLIRRADPKGPALRIERDVPGDDSKGVLPATAAGEKTIGV